MSNPVPQSVKDDINRHDWDMRRRSNAVLRVSRSIDYTCYVLAVTLPAAAWWLDLPWIFAGSIYAYYEADSGLIVSSLLKRAMADIESAR